MSRLVPGRPLDRDAVERGLRAARTKREFDTLVDTFRRPGSLTLAERETLEVLARELVQRFGTVQELAHGVEVRAGRGLFGFRNVLRAK